MRDSRAEPVGVIRRLLFNRQVVSHVLTWAPTAEGGQFVGYFPSLGIADRSIKVRPLILEAAPVRRTAADRHRPYAGT